MTRHFCIALFALVGITSTHAGDWPEFRGPGQQGHSDEKNLPLTWSETENIAWKTDLPGLGWSSPSIAGNRIWITTAVKRENKSEETSEEKATDQPDDIQLFAICLDRDSGEILKSVLVFEKEKPEKIHGKNSHASPTPVIERDRVYVHFGNHGTACLTIDGDVVWKTSLPYNHRHGPAGSPIIFHNLLIITCDGTDTQYITALNKETGAEVWKTMREEGRMAYSTPTLIDFEGQPQLITAGGEFITTYDPATGKEIWKFRYPKGYSVVPRPVVSEGIAFASSGYDNPIFYAVKLGGEGDVTESHLAWKTEKGAPRNASPIIVGDEVYIISDNGVACCFDVKTGKQHWQKRVGGDYSASPLYADGRIYLTSEAGLTTVLEPGRKYNVLAENQLPGRSFASLATADGALFFRNETALYRLQNK